MKKWVFAILVVLGIVVWQLWALYDGILDRQEKRFEKAVSVAKQHVQLKRVLDVTYYHGTKSYHVVKAVKQGGKTVYIWVPDKKGKVMVKPEKEGLSKSKVKDYAEKNLNLKKLIDIRLGAENGNPVWEITYVDKDGRYTFYYLRFDGKDWIKNIHL